VAPAGLSAAGYAEWDPLGPNTDAGNRARNRRIEISLVPNIEELISLPDLKGDPAQPAPSATPPATPSPSPSP
jgi:hypothetical protein